MRWLSTLPGLLALSFVWGLAMAGGPTGAAEAKRSLAPIYPIENAIKIDGNVTDWDWAPELLGKDPRIQPMGEMWYAHLFRHPRTRRVYLIAEPNAQPLVLLYEVTGLEQVRRFEGQCSLSSLGAIP